MVFNYVNPWLLYWLATNSIGGTVSGEVGRTTTSPLGSGDFADLIELEELKKTLRIIEYRERLNSLEQANFSVATGRFFLPSTTLQIGAKKSLAVCRISRYFSLKDFQGIIRWIQGLREEYRQKYQSKDVLKEIFSISDELANQIFKTTTNEFLNDLIKISDEPLSKLNPIPWGTGFLVGGTQLLTNYHIIPTEEIAEQCIAEFNYVEDIWGNTNNSVFYEFEPKALFACNPKLDYTLVQLRTSLSKNPAGYNFGWIPLIEKEDNIAPGITYTFDEKIPKSKIEETIQNLKKDDKITIFKNEETQKNDIELYSVKELIETFSGKKICCIYPKYDNFEEVSKIYTNQWEKLCQKIENDVKKIIDNILPKPKDPNNYKYQTGEPVIVIQHPKGRKKEIILFSNKVIDNGLLKNYLRYSADTDYGSSGSPVFNAQWELVALHHAAIPNLDSEVTESDPNNKTIANQGVRICRIIEDLKKQSTTNYQLKSFIEDYVITLEQISYPPLPSGLEFNGLDSYVKLESSFPNQQNESQSFTVEAWVKPDIEGGPVASLLLTSSSGEICQFRLRITSTSNDSGSLKYNFSGLRSGDGEIDGVEIGKFNHLAATINFEENSTEIQLYVNGKNKHNQPYIHNVSNKTPISFTPQIKLIGAFEDINNIDRANIPSVNDFFKGAITEIRLWTLARKKSEIQQTMFHRLNTKNPDWKKENLVGYWRFEEELGEKIYNSNSLIGDGLNYGAKQIRASQYPAVSLSFGLVFNGENELVFDQKNTNENEIKKITVEGWVRHKFGNCLIVSGGSKKDDRISLDWSLSWDDGKIYVTLGSKTKICTQNNAPTDEVWHHLAFTWDMSQDQNQSSFGEVSIYIDGQLQGIVIVSSSSEKLTWKKNSDVRIGKRKESVDDRDREIAIGEVRIWNKVRTQIEIRENRYRRLYNSDEENLVGYWRLDDDTRGGEQKENKEIEVSDSSSKQNNGRILGKGNLGSTIEFYNKARFGDAYTNSL
ncbi:LamG-like jellyroll fold domain-containing protein [Floridanema evergladense]|uniref:LamG-like jellyroll fold domain-containing protein n=1 Tax=Floridaenema evergladense BLCC-F167 TaxID=3153639 RepID=A0ABV4WYM2_9CYAN